MQILCAVLLLILVVLLIYSKVVTDKLREANAKLQEAAVLLNIAGEQFIKIAEAVKEANNNEEENE